MLTVCHSPGVCVCVRGHIISYRISIIQFSKRDSHVDLNGTRKCAQFIYILLQQQRQQKRGFWSILAVANHHHPEVLYADTNVHFEWFSATKKLPGFRFKSRTLLTIFYHHWKIMQKQWNHSITIHLSTSQYTSARREFARDKIYRGAVKMQFNK